MWCRPIRAIRQEYLDKQFWAEGYLAGKAITPLEIMGDLHHLQPGVRQRRHRTSSPKCWSRTGRSRTPWPMPSRSWRRRTERRLFEGFTL